MNKKNIINTISFLIGSIITLLFLYIASFVLQRKDSYFKSKDFFNEKQPIDVIFLGTSHGVNAFFPMKLWADYGIVSYNLSYHNAMLPMQYWVLKNALNIKKPRLVVIDLFWLSQPWKSDPNHFGTVHTTFDEFPLSFDKISMANDILDDSIPEAKNKKAKFALLFPFSLYHTRWSENFYNDKFDIGVEKGAESRINVEKSTTIFEKIEREDRISDDSIGVKYLEKIIDLCKKNDIEIMLTYLPFAAWADCQREANLGYVLSKRYGIDFLNFLENIEIINFNTDRYDSVGHLNPSGARKVNNYLGKYILENYDISDHRLEPLYSKWNSDYLRYKDFKIENLKNQNSLDTYLMLCSDHHFIKKIKIKNFNIYLNNLYSELLKNLGNDYAQIESDVNLDADIYIEVFDSSNLIDTKKFNLE